MKDNLATRTGAREPGIAGADLTPKQDAAGEAPIQKVTLSHVGGRWQESMLMRYLIQYQIRPVFQSLVCPLASSQSGTEAE